MAMVILSASVESFSVSRMQNFNLCILQPMVSHRKARAKKLLECIRSTQCMINLDKRRQCLYTLLFFHNWNIWTYPICTSGEKSLRAPGPGNVTRISWLVAISLELILSMEVSANTVSEGRTGGPMLHHATANSALEIETNLKFGSRVIPYKSTEKNMIFFFFRFLTKKIKGFWYFSNKKRFFNNFFCYFWPLLECFLRFFLIFLRFKKWDLKYNVFSFLFSS